MNKHFKFVTLLISFSLILGACTQPTESPTEELTSEPVAPTATLAPTPTLEETEPVELNNDILYVNLTWHQHQPLYYKDSEGVYTRPWVRVHATKDYLDMAEKVAAHEGVQATFNITPSLIRQLNDLASGAKDKYWVLAEKPVSELSQEEKRFILERFFDANWTNIIARFPRYQALLDKRGGSDAASLDAALESFTEQDFFDLQVWFNLAWFDPVYLAEEPLASLVAKGEGFNDTDKTVLFEQVLEKVQAVIPYHQQLQDEGIIEVTTTPYAHPILPLIYDNQLALVGNPSAEMPDQEFSYPLDAQAHLETSVVMYEENFGREVRGLWPGEGSVAQAIVPLVVNAGYTFMQTGEPVLAKSLGIDAFTRDGGGFVQQADDLYRPYYVTDEAGNQVGMFFRDGVLSDNLGFVYSGMGADAAATDLVNHLEDVHAYFVENEVAGPHIVSIILDGENAWEYYPNDGNDFLNAMYQQLSDSDVLEMVTPSTYLEMYPEQRVIEDLFPGAWFSPNYDTWIGETEEAIAWDYLAKVRADLAQYETGEISVDEDALAEAFDFMYLAEGSDWFWWYGDDQDSGQDSYFDEGYRALLTGVYESLGVEVPRFVQVPIIQARAVSPTTQFGGVSSPVIDGLVDEAWDTAAYYEMASDMPVSGMYYAIDEENLYLRLDANGSLVGKTAGFYFNLPNTGISASAFSRESDQLLGFNASKLFEWSGGDTLNPYDGAEAGWEALDTTFGTVVSDEIVEISLPLEVLGDFSAGDSLKMALVIEPDAVQLPLGGPARIVIPNLGQISAFLEVEDPVGDDYGPGTYTYPTDAVFQDSVYDAEKFMVGVDGDNLVFVFGLVGPIENSWGSPNDLSVQTLDVYIDTDPGEGTGARMLFPGRNAALMADYGWEYAIWAEGWTPQVVQPDPETLEPKNYSEASSAMNILVDPAQSTVTIRVPMSFLPEGNPEEWAYAAVVLSQEGYPTEGVWRVRNIGLQSAQWVFGGGPGHANQTRIIDVVIPENSEFDQATLLSDYAGVMGSLDGLTPDDFAQIPMLIPGEN